MLKSLINILNNIKTKYISPVFDHKSILSHLKGAQTKRKVSQKETLNKQQIPETDKMCLTTVMILF